MVVRLQDTRQRIGYASEKLLRVERDQQLWNGEESSCATWLLEDLAEQLTRLHSTLTELDLDTFSISLTLPNDEAAVLVEQSRGLCMSWLKTARDVHAQLQNANRLCQTIADAEVLAALIREMQDCLAPDDELFSDGLRELRDRAIADADTGNTRDLIDDPREAQS